MTRAQGRQAPRTPSRAVQDAAAATTPADFLRCLDSLRTGLALSYARIGERAGAGMSKSTAQALVRGDALPNPRQLQLFLRGCGVSAEEGALWRKARDRIEGDADLATGVADTVLEEEPPAVAEATPPLEAESPEVDPQEEPPPAGPAPWDEWERVSHRRRTWAGVRALVAFTVVTGVSTGCAIAMWKAGVPAEVMMAAYFVVFTSIGAWLSVMGFHRGSESYRREWADVDAESVFDKGKAANPVIGL